MSLRTRRGFLQDALGAAIGLALAGRAQGATAAPAATALAGGVTGGFLTDTNVSIGQYPFRRLAHDEPVALVTLLRRCGANRAWAGSLEGLLHRDIAGVNLRLMETCRGSAGLLLPFGTINPALPDWEEDLRRCHEVHRMPGIRLYPNYHGYKLGDPRFLRLAGAAGDRGLVIQIATQIEDRRTQHPSLVAQPVELSALADAAGRFPRTAFVVLGTSLASPLATRLAGAGRVYFEISHHEGLQGLSRAFQSVPVERVLFGSHAPLFVYEANLLKLRESLLTDEQLLAVASGNAERLLSGITASSA